jgi:glycerol-3-phosphate acyltransferase PlsY
MSGVLIKVLISYLLGSVSGSVLIGKLRHVDIRTMGSGNAGGTNAFRTQGLIFALAVIVIDISKAALATAWIAPMEIAGLQTEADQSTVTLLCGFAVVLGHCYPLFHGFRGGKGAATAVGAMAIIQPLLLAPMLLTWLIVLGLSGYVGLATVIAGFSLVPAAWYIDSTPGLLIFTIAIALFMTFTHRSNLKRLKNGVENRFEKARFSNWFRR